MGKCLFIRKGEAHTAPKVPGIPLSSIAEGSLVKINESGSPVEFYVAKHNYESGLNGAGRTLLVRKDCYDERVWDADNVNTYSGSDIDSWLNGSYLSLLGETERSAAGKTRFYYTVGGGDTTVTTLSRAVFLLSSTEVGQDVQEGYTNEEGPALPIAESLKIAELYGSAVDQWTRTPFYLNPNMRQYVMYAGSGGETARRDCTDSKGARPCFTLPATALFDEETLTFKEVA